MKKRWFSAMVLLCVFVCDGSAFAQPAQRTLAKTEELHPQGWSVGEQVKFKKGSVITTNGLGAVTEGTLADNTYLRPQGWRRVVNDFYFVSAYAERAFYPPRYYRYWNNTATYNMAMSSYGHIRYKGGTPVVFSPQGTVLRGVIADETAVGLVEGQYGFVSYRKGTVLAFYESGAVKTGTLAEHTKLRPVGWQENAAELQAAGFVEFAAKAPVVLTEAGEVTQGKLKAALRWKNSADSSEFPAGTVVRFDRQGARAVPQDEADGA